MDTITVTTTRTISSSDIKIVNPINDLTKEVESLKVEVQRLRRRERRRLGKWTHR